MKAYRIEDIELYESDKGPNEKLNNIPLKTILNNNIFSFFISIEKNLWIPL